jgi:tetratricopeptide (TPR) repeat protein
MTPDRYTGMLLTLLERYDEAEPHFDNALDLEERIKAPPLAARTRYWYARMLLARKAEGDADRARALLDDALETAERLGMVKLAEQCRELGRS